MLSALSKAANFPGEIRNTTELDLPVSLSLSSCIVSITSLTAGHLLARATCRFETTVSRTKQIKAKLTPPAFSVITQ